MRHDIGTDRSDAHYCPICGKGYGDPGHCSEATLRAIDAAGKREDAPAFMTFPSETQRLIAGLEILGFGDDERAYYEEDPLHRHGINPPEDVQEKKLRERY
jgi:hypothetical protein